jgi:hypothetical protein
MFSIFYSFPILDSLCFICVSNEIYFLVYQEDENLFSVKYHALPTSHKSCSTIRLKKKNNDCALQGMSAFLSAVQKIHIMLYKFMYITLPWIVLTNS